MIDVPALRDDLQLLNHSNIAKVQADLRAGTEPGESDVFLHVMEPKRTLLQAFADNNGSKSTGLYRGGLLAQVYGLAGYDDQLTVQAVGTSQAGAFNGMLQYDLPVNKRGGRLTIGYQQGDIQIVKGHLLLWILQVIAKSVIWDIHSLFFSAMIFGSMRLQMRAIPKQIP